MFFFLRMAHKKKTSEKGIEIIHSHRFTDHSSQGIPSTTAIIHSCIFPYVLFLHLDCLIYKQVSNIPYIIV